MNFSTKRFFPIFFICLTAFPLLIVPLAQSAEVTNLKLARLSIVPKRVMENGKWIPFDGFRARSFKIDIGEINLDNFKSTSISMDGDDLLFYATVDYTVGINYFSDISYDKFIKQEFTKNSRWLQIYEYKLRWDGGGNVVWDNYLDYNVNFKHLSVYDSGGLYQYPEFEINFEPINSQLLKTSAESNVTLKSAITGYNYDLIKTLDAGITDLATYDVSYGNWNGAELKYRDVNDLSQDPRSQNLGQFSPDIKSNLLGRFLTEGTGVEAKDPYWSIGHVQSVATADTINTTIIPTAEPNSTKATFRTNVQLRPQVDVLKQRIQIKRAFVEHRYKYDWWDEQITAFETLTDDSDTYIRGLKIQNKVVQQRYRFRINLVSRLELKGEIEPRQLLALPSAEFGAVYWDMSINGNTEAFITFLGRYGISDLFHDTTVASNTALANLQQWMPYIVGAIILIAVIYVIIQFQPMIRAAVQSKSRRM